MNTRNLVLSALLWLLLLTVPLWVVAAGGYVDLASRVLVIGLAALATNLLVGHAGVMAFGHAAYFGISAYATGLVMKHLVPSTPVGLLAGIVVGTAGGAVIGYLLARLRGMHRRQQGRQVQERQLLDDGRHRPLRPVQRDLL